VEETIAIDPTVASTDAVELAASGSGTGTGSLLAGPDGVWVLDQSGFAWQIATSGEIAGRVDQPGLKSEAGLATNADSLWTLTDTGFNEVTLPGGALTEHALDQPSPFNGPQVLATRDAVWLGSGGGILRVKPDTAAVEATVPGVSGPLGEADGLVWGAQGQAIVGIDPATNGIARTIGKPAEVGSLLTDSSTIVDGTLWIVARPAGDQLGTDHWFQLLRIDLATGATSHRDLVNAEHDYIIGLAATDEDVWASDFARGNVLRIAA